MNASFNEHSHFVDERDSDGKTSLCRAIRCGHEREARDLIDKGANPYLTDNCGVNSFICYVATCLSNDELDKIFTNELFREEHKEALKIALLNVLYCHAPLLAVSGLPRLIKSYKILQKEKVLQCLALLREQCSIQYADRVETIETNIRENAINVSDILDLLSLLTDLGAKAEAVDSRANTPLHYATLLPLFGVAPDDVREIFNRLRFLGALRSVQNYERETALLFCLSNALKVITESNGLWSVEGLVKVCEFLLELTNDLQNSHSILHTIIPFISEGLKVEAWRRDDVLQLVKGVFEILPENKKVLSAVVNYTDNESNSPLHLWAAIKQDHDSILETIFEYLRKYGANVNFRNTSNETPLHLCRTWTAAKLLLDARANPNDKTSSGDSLLLAAAKRKGASERKGRLYPDVTESPQLFWSSVSRKGCDLWLKDNGEETVLSVLLKSNDCDLSKALINFAIKNGTNMHSILNVICKDKCKHTGWKIHLVKNILESAGINRLDADRAFRLCCANIDTFNIHRTSDKLSDSVVNDGEPPTKKAKKDEFDKKEEEKHESHGEEDVHYKIVMLLLIYGVNPCFCYGANSSSSRDTVGHLPTCLLITVKNERLKELLAEQVKNGIPKFFWDSKSEKHKSQLEKVADRKQYILFPKTNILHHKDKIASGSYGNFYVGIDRKNGKEICVKRYEKSCLNRQEDRTEETILRTLAGCDQIVQLLLAGQESTFSYLVLDLMEGNLENLIDGQYDEIDTAERTRLCKDVLVAGDYLHNKGFIHCNLKPQSILYKRKPNDGLHKWCLKIANFSRAIVNASTTRRDINEEIHTNNRWLAPEVSSRGKHFTLKSDVFPSGNICCCILSGQKHPFSSDGTANTNGISPEGTDLIEKMTKNDENLRASMAEALKHPIFWSIRRKVTFLGAVAKQEDFAFRRYTRVNRDLTKAFPEFRSNPWNTDTGMRMLYNGMTRHPDSRTYNTQSVMGLVEFIRNTYEHYQDNFPPSTGVNQTMLDNVFFRCFPKLVIEVYRTITTHGWDETRDKIKSILDDHGTI